MNKHITHTPTFMIKHTYIYTHMHILTHLQVDFEKNHKRQKHHIQTHTY